MGHQLATDQVGPFALAGDALFTIRNTKTGNRLTFRIEACKDKAGLYFVSVLTGPENTHSYTYLGLIRGSHYAHGRKSRIKEDAQSAQAFAWFWTHLTRLPACVEVFHEGRCGRCG
jgi:hypothetical protein